MAERAMSEAKKQYRVYNGGEPYGFISYAHKDAARVLPVIAALSRDRFRLWYDAGIWTAITPGSSPTTTIRTA